MLRLRALAAAALTGLAVLPVLPHSASAMEGYLPLWTTMGWDFTGSKHSVCSR